MSKLQTQPFIATASNLEVGVEAIVESKIISEVREEFRFRAETVEEWSNKHSLSSRAVYRFLNEKTSGFCSESEPVLVAMLIDPVPSKAKELLHIGPAIAKGPFAKEDLQRIKKALVCSGDSQKDWASRNGFDEHLLRNILAGKNLASYGESRDIGIALGLVLPIELPIDLTKQARPNQPQYIFIDEQFERVKAEFYKRGDIIPKWAKLHGFATNTVYRFFEGKIAKLGTKGLPIGLALGLVEREHNDGAMVSDPE